MTPDVNVLVAAARSDHPHHLVARPWLEGALAAIPTGASFTLMPMVLASVLRLLTSPKIFVEPTPVSDAVAFVDAVMAVPGVRLLALGAEWPRLRQLCLDGPLAGNDLPDAWLAAAVEQHGEQLVSFDRDFRKLLPRSRFIHLRG
jgi:toxin-antitoxin system PIN domain toxin